MTKFRELAGTISTLKPYTHEGNRYMGIELSAITDNSTGRVVMPKCKFSTPFDRFERRLMFYWSPILVKGLLGGKIIFDRSSPIKEGDEFLPYDGAPDDKVLTADRDMIINNISSIDSTTERLSIFDHLTPIDDSFDAGEIAPDDDEVFEMPEEESSEEAPTTAKPKAPRKAKS